MVQIYSSRFWCWLWSTSVLKHGGGGVMFGLGSPARFVFPFEMHFKWRRWGGNVCRWSHQLKCHLLFRASSCFCRTFPQSTGATRRWVSCWLKLTDSNTCLQMLPVTIRGSSNWSGTGRTGLRSADTRRLWGNMEDDEVTEWLWEELLWKWRPMGGLYWEDWGSGLDTDPQLLGPEVLVCGSMTNVCDVVLLTDDGCRFIFPF